MKRVWGIALLVGIGLIFAGGSQAKTIPHRVKCRTGYVRRTVMVPRRREGRIVRTHGKIVYTRVQRCVKVRKRKAPSPPVSVSTTPTTILLPPFPPLGSPPPFTQPPASSAPANTAAPTISGAATEGNTLSASTGTWANGPTSYAYEWQRCDASGGSCDASGVTASTYSVSAADLGSTIRVSVTAGNAAGSASATSAATGRVGSGASPGDPVVVAVGDIACAPGNPDNVACQQSATEAVAANQHPSAVLVLGDNQYDSGLYSEYTGRGAYDSTWGVFQPIVHPVPGNHEYAASSSAAGYFQYFGAAAHSPEGYYSFNLGTWHIVALNSDCSESGCADATYGSSSTGQLTWLQSDLAQNTRACVLAMWHHPLLSSGWTYGSVGVAPLWNALYSAHADVVLNGHDHLYERYAQLGVAQTASPVPTADVDPNGIREFVVGTGGESLNPLSSIGAQPQASDSQFGVLVLTLHASSYDWKFVNTGGKTLDSGTAPCHGPGTGSSSALTAGDARAPRVVALSGPPLVLDARPLGSSLTAILEHGLPVAVHLSRAADVTVNVSMRRGHHLQPIASFYETESQIPGPYSRILLHLPARPLTGVRAVTLVLQFAAVDAARHRRMETRTVSLGSG